MRREIRTADIFWKGLKFLQIELFLVKEQLVTSYIIINFNLSN